MNIGIDLGTSNTVVAYECEGEIHYLEYDDLRELSERRSAYVKPSKVFRSAGDDEDDAIRVGTSEKIYDKDGEWYTSRGIINGMMEEIYKSLVKVFPNEIEFRATVAIPMSFSMRETQNILEAVQYENEEEGKCICLSDVKMIYEPIAAYLACMDEVEELREAKRILVIDMGGGTLDICDVHRAYSYADEKSKVIARRIGGDRRLGGDTFDTVLARLITDRINDSYIMERLEKRQNYKTTIMKCSRTLKEKLQYKDDAAEEEKFDICFGEDTYHVQISRKHYYAEAEVEINKVQEAINDAKRTLGESCDKILVVGGMSAEPFLQEYVKEKFGKEKTIILDQSEENFYGIVAKGAAIINGNTNLAVRNTILYAIGVKRANGDIDIIFEADKELNDQPVKREYIPAEGNRYSIQFPVVECNKNNTIMRELLRITIDNIPQGEIEDQAIIVEFKINQERNLEVKAHAKADESKKCNCTIVF